MENRNKTALATEMPATKKITLSGIVIALYIILMYLTQGFAFGQYQVRIATALYGLSAVYPFLILPLAVSNFLSNTLLGGLGILDMVGGFAVGLVTAAAVYQIKKRHLRDDWIALPIILGPGLLVPIWLSRLIGVPYWILAVSISIGQVIPGITAVLLVRQIQRKIKT